MKIKLNEDVETDIGYNNIIKHIWDSIFVTGVNYNKYFKEGGFEIPLSNFFGSKYKDVFVVLDFVKTDNYKAEGQYISYNNEKHLIKIFYNKKDSNLEYLLIYGKSFKNFKEKIYDSVLFNRFKNIFIHEFKHLINKLRFKGTNDEYEKHREYDPLKQTEMEKYLSSEQEYDSHFSELLEWIENNIQDEYFTLGFNTFIDKIKSEMNKDLPKGKVKSNYYILFNKWRKKTLRRLYQHFKKWKENKNMNNGVNDYKQFNKIYQEIKTFSVWKLKLLEKRKENLIKVYHGDNFGLTHINKNYDRIADPKGNMANGLGIYFAKDVEHAKRYGNKIVSTEVDINKLLPAKEYLSDYVSINKIAKLLHYFYMNSEEFWMYYSDYGIELIEKEDYQKYYSIRLAEMISEGQVRNVMIELWQKVDDTKIFVDGWLKYIGYYGTYEKIDNDIVVALIYNEKTIEHYSEKSLSGETLKEFKEGVLEENQEKQNFIYSIGKDVFSKIVEDLKEKLSIDNKDNLYTFSFRLSDYSIKKVKNLIDTVMVNIFIIDNIKDKKKSGEILVKKTADLYHVEINIFISKYFINILIDGEENIFLRTYQEIFSHEFNHLYYMANNIKLLNKNNNIKNVDDYFSHPLEFIAHINVIINNIENIINDMSDEFLDMYKDNIFSKKDIDNFLSIKDLDTFIDFLRKNKNFDNILKIAHMLNDKNFKYRKKLLKKLNELWDDVKNKIFKKQKYIKNYLKNNDENLILDKELSGEESIDEKKEIKTFSEWKKYKLLIEHTIQELKIGSFDTDREKIEAIYEIEYKYSKIKKNSTINPKRKENILEILEHTGSELLDEMISHLENGLEDYITYHGNKDFNAFYDEMIDSIGGDKELLNYMLTKYNQLDLQDYIDDKLLELMVNEGDYDYIFEKYIENDVIKLVEVFFDYYYDNETDAREYLENKENISDIYDLKKWFIDNHNLPDIINIDDIYEIPYGFEREIMKKVFVDFKQGLYDNFSGVDDILDDAEDYIEKLKNFDSLTFKEKNVIFNEALNLFHYSGLIASDYAKLDVTGEFLDEMSDRDVSDWDEELKEIGVNI